jgi:hypothetical protein
MPNFTAGTSFTDGVTNDVTALKLNALVADAVPTSSLALTSTNGTISNFTSSTATLLGAITGSTNVVNIGSGQIYKDATGNVGVGTASPSAKLDVSADVRVGQGQITADTTVGNLGIYGGMASGTTNAQLRFFGKSVSNTGQTYEIARISGSSFSSAYSLSGGLQFSTALNDGANNLTLTERLRIDSSGNVGIGTTSPGATLEVVGNQIIKNTSDNDGSTQAALGIGRNTVAGDTFLAIGTNQTNDYSFIQSQNAGNPTYYNLLLNPKGGNVGIGTASPSAQLELSIDSAKKPSTNTWTIASDQRLKTNITNADNDRCYEIVKQVPLKRYTWKSEVYSQEQVKDRSKLGWIAQDVEAVFPKAVGTNRFVYNQVFENVVTPELDSDGNAVLDENGVAKTKTEKRLVSEDVIEDCKDLNSDQIYAAMYGTIQKLIEKVELLESKVATLEAA